MIAEDSISDVPIVAEDSLSDDSMSLPRNKKGINDLAYFSNLLYHEGVAGAMTKPHVLSDTLFAGGLTTFDLDGHVPDLLPGE